MRDPTPAATPMLDFSTLPNFCSHEHWGSLASFTMTPEGFRNDVYQGARPQRRHSLVDLVLDPYLHGWIWAAGGNTAEFARAVAGTDDIWQAAADHPGELLVVLRPLLRQHELTGALQCIRRGIHFCLGVDIMTASAAELDEADARCATAYETTFPWYRDVMARASFTKLIRPVHPEYFVWSDGPDLAVQDRAINDPILRIDPLMDLWSAESPRRDGLAKITGVDPADAASWRKFLDKVFGIARDCGTTGIKQLQAYTRDLDYKRRADGEVRFRGDLSPAEVTAFQDWVMHECFARAHELGWPHQVHIGTHNHPRSNPLPLEAAAKAYPRQQLVLLHCWPYLSESGYLAKQLPNVHIDTCWQPVLNPQFFRRALREWLGYVPTHKIMLAHDATSIEMAVGSSLFTREILAEELWRWGGGLGLGEARLRAIATDMLHNNAVRLYGIGELAAP